MYVYFFLDVHSFVKTLAKENKGGVKISWSPLVGFTYFMSTEWQMFSPFTVYNLCGKCTEIAAQAKNSSPISTSTHTQALSPEKKIKAWKSCTLFHMFMSVASSKYVVIVTSKNPRHVCYRLYLRLESCAFPWIHSLKLITDCSGYSAVLKEKALCIL